MSNLPESARTPRNLETRRHETRDAETKKIYSFDFDSRFNVSQVLRDKYPDKVFDFIPYQVGGELLDDQIDYCFNRRGYEFVKAHMDPSQSRRASAELHGRKEEEQHIKIGGQILMMRDKEIAKLEAKHFDEELNRQRAMSEQHKMGGTKFNTIIDQRKFETS